MAVSVVTPTKKKNEYEKYSNAASHFGSVTNAQNRAIELGLNNYDGSERQDKLLIKLDETDYDNKNGYILKKGNSEIFVTQGAQPGRDAQPAQRVISGNSNGIGYTNMAGKGAVTPQASPQTPSQSSNNPSNSNTTSAIVADATNFLMQQANALRGGNTRYSRQADTALSRVLNREKFSYDMNADPLFQQALSSAMNNGQMAMRNTMAQASALTGGYGSSYATTAGNQAYNDFIQDAYDNLPQYYNMALQAYQMETDNLLNEYALLSEADNQAYQRALDSYNIAYNMRNRLYDEEYQLGRDKVTDTRYNTEWDYQLGRDDIADKRYEDEWNWQKETDNRDYEYQLGRDEVNDTRYNNEWGYQLERDEISDERYENEWKHQQEQDAADNYYRQQAFNHEVEQDMFNNQLNGDRNGDGKLSEEEMDYLSSLNSEGKETNDESDEGLVPIGEDEDGKTVYVNPSKIDSGVMDNVKNWSGTKTELETYIERKVPNLLSVDEAAYLIAVYVDAMEEDENPFSFGF